MTAQKDGKPPHKYPMSSQVDSFDGSLYVLHLQLHRVTVDHMSDAFVDVFGPLNALLKAAQEGDRTLVDRQAEIFQRHAEMMLKVATIRTSQHVCACITACMGCCCRLLTCCPDSPGRWTGLRW